jgi:hypothetical protein
MSVAEARKKAGNEEGPLVATATDEACYASAAAACASQVHKQVPEDASKRGCWAQSRLTERRLALRWNEHCCFKSKRLKNRLAQGSRSERLTGGN